jgi:hypothetical protein
LSLASSYWQIKAIPTGETAKLKVADSAKIIHGKIVITRGLPRNWGTISDFHAIHRAQLTTLQEVNYGMQLQAP